MKKYPLYRVVGFFIFFFQFFSENSPKWNVSLSCEVSTVFRMNRQWKQTLVMKERLGKKGKKNSALICFALQPFHLLAPGTLPALG